MTERAHPAGPPRGSRLDPWLVLLLGLAVFLPGLGAHDLWNPDEPRYAAVSRAMLESGDLLIPRLNGGPYTEKPPLMFWAMAASAAVRGRFDEAAVRWPSAAAGVGTLLVVYALGVTLFDRRSAWLAVAVASSTWIIVWKGHVGQIDMLLTFLVAAGVLAWCRAHFAGRERLVWLFYAAAGLATLAKGPVGLVPALLAVVAFLAWERDRAGLRALRLGRGLLVWAAVVALWLVPALMSGGRAYFDEIVLRQNLTRYVEPWGHHQPWYYFATVVPVDFFPWTFLAPAALVALWTASDRGSRRSLRLLLAWIAVTVLFFSVSQGKRGVYVLPIYPALAVLVGAGLREVALRVRETAASPRAPLQALVAWPASLLALLGAGLAVALPVVAASRPEARPLGGDFPALLAATLAPLAAGCALGAALAWTRRPAALAAAVCAGMILTTTLLFTAVCPRFDRVKSARPLARLVAARAGADEPIGVYPRLDPAVLFYAERALVPLHDPGELAAFAREPGPRWLLAERDALARARVALPLVEVARDNDVLQGYVLLASPRASATRGPPSAEEEAR